MTLALVCLVPWASFADTLQWTGEGGQSTDGWYVDPYFFTVTDPGVSDTLVSMSCLNFDRDISIEESWNVTAIDVSSVTPSETIDAESGVDILADAYLYNQYASATGNAQQTSDLQFAMQRPWPRRPSAWPPPCPPATLQQTACSSPATAIPTGANPRSS